MVSREGLPVQRALQLEEVRSGQGQQGQGGKRGRTFSSGQRGQNVHVPSSRPRNRARGVK